MSKRDELHCLPLYQKSEQIFKITQGLVAIVPVDNGFLQETTVRFMMENATISRKAAKELYVQECRQTIYFKTCESCNFF